MDMKMYWEMFVKIIILFKKVKIMKKKWIFQKKIIVIHKEKIKII